MARNYKKWKTTGWSVYLYGRYPNADVKVLEDGKIQFAIFPTKDCGTVQGYQLSRDFARMLARRINQALDDTKG